MRILIAVAILIAASACTYGQEVRRVACIDDAALLAAEDLEKIDPKFQPNIRYIWIPPWHLDNGVQAASYTLNEVVSRASVVLKPQVIASDGVVLVRVDLGLYAPKINDYEELVDVWEDLSLFERYFSTPIKLGVVSKVKDLLPGQPVQINTGAFVEVPEVRFSFNGDLRWTEVKVLKNTNSFVQVRSHGRDYTLNAVTKQHHFRLRKIPAEAQDAIFLAFDGQFVVVQTLDKQVLKLKEDQVAFSANVRQRDTVFNPTLGDVGKLLHKRTGSQVPLVRLEPFIYAAWSSVDGGLYYDFAGIKVSNDPQVTDLDLFLDQFGVQIGRAKDNNALTRAGMLRSNVTGKPRVVDFLYATTVRPGSGSGLVTITNDITDFNFNADFQWMLNLLDFKSQAFEIIAERPNGTHVYVLFDGNGDLQLSAPDNVASDHTVPAPHTTRLQSGISCIRCHNMPVGMDGMQPAHNDFQSILASLTNYGNDAFDDLAISEGITFEEALDKLTSEYGNQTDIVLARARIAYQDVISRATGYANPKSVSLAASAVADIYSNYWYDMVSPRQALLELGYEVKTDSDAIDLFNSIYPPALREEHGYFLALKAGSAITRLWWEDIYIDAAIRASNNPVHISPDKNSTGDSIWNDQNKQQPPLERLPSQSSSPLPSPWDMVDVPKQVTAEPSEDSPHNDTLDSTTNSTTDSTKDSTKDSINLTEDLVLDSMAEITSSSVPSSDKPHTESVPTPSTETTPMVDLDSVADTVPTHSADMVTADTSTEYNNTDTETTAASLSLVQRFMGTDLLVSAGILVTTMLIILILHLVTQRLYGRTPNG